MHHTNGDDQQEIYLQHSYNELQIEWFYAGSALNVFCFLGKISETYSYIIIIYPSII